MNVQSATFFLQHRCRNRRPSSHCSRGFSPKTRCVRYVACGFKLHISSKLSTRPAAVSTEESVTSVALYTGAMGPIKQRGKDGCYLHFDKICVWDWCRASRVDVRPVQDRSSLRLASSYTQSRPTCQGARTFPARQSCVDARYVPKLRKCAWLLAKHTRAEAKVLLSSTQSSRMLYLTTCP